MAYIMKIFAAFGELMLRLSPPGRETLLQSPRLVATFGGAEANVAVSLARFGHEVRYVSVIPANEIGEAAVRELRGAGVATDFILRKGRRLGIYFAETGANQRPSKVLYDRDHAAIAEARPEDIDWGRVFAGVEAFHITGITPALSATAAELAREAVRAARAKNLQVSVDLNFRAKLWRYGQSAPEVMPDIIKLADLIVANEEDLQKALGFEAAAAPGSGRLDVAQYEALTARVMKAYPNLTRLAVTLRESHGADWNDWSAVVRTTSEFLAGPRYEIRAIVDRIGTGDAFTAGWLHGLDVFGDDRKALAFAVAAGCLKHSYPGDFNPATEKDVLALMGGEASGRVQR